MDPRIGSLFDLSPARLAAICSHCGSEAENDGPAPKAPSAPWSATHYSTLAPFARAHESFHRLNGPQILESAIAPLFNKWKVTSLFGVSLLYPSITLPADSIPVSRGRTLTAWPWSLYQSTPFTDCIREAAWRLVDGRWTAYEYAYDGEEVACNTLEQASKAFVEDELQGFLDVFGMLLVKHDLNGVLGLRALPNADFQGWVEVGQGAMGLRLETVTTRWKIARGSSTSSTCGMIEIVRGMSPYPKVGIFSASPIKLTKEVPLGSEDSDRVGSSSKLDFIDSPHALGRHEPEPEVMMADGWIPPVEPPEDFHSTLRKFSNTMVVEDIEVMGDGTVRFHGRSVQMAQRPKSR